MSLYLACVKRGAIWWAGEHEDAAAIRRRDRAPLHDSTQQLPRDFPGQLAWLKPAGEPYDPVDRDLYDLVELDITEAATAGLRSGRYKIPSGLKVVADVTFEDIYGATAADLHRLFPDAGTDEEEREQANIHAAMRHNAMLSLAYEVEIREWKKRTALALLNQVLGVEGSDEPKPLPYVPTPIPTPVFSETATSLRRALPKTIVHTGTGNYYVKATPNSNADSVADVTGQLLALSDAIYDSTWVGGYITNLARSQTRAIVSVDDTDEMTMAGDISTWQLTDAVIVYDSWSTFHSTGALDQLYIDQGGANFTTNQYIRIFAGTYDEGDITPNASLDPIYGYCLVIEGDPTDSRANIIVQPSSGTEVFYVNNSGTTILRHMTVDGSNVAQETIQGFTGTDFVRVDDCAVTGGAFEFATVSAYNHGAATDCVVTANNGHGILIGAAGAGDIARCTVIQAGARGTSWGIYVGESNRIEATDVAGFYEGFRRVLAEGPLLIKHCVVYDCTRGVWVNGGTACAIEVHNTIFHTVTNVFYWNNGVWPEETATSIGNAVQLCHNCYYNYTNFGNNVAATKTYAEVAAMDRVDASGDLNATDPKLTDAPGGDFSLAADSPCRRAGIGTGVLYDVNGNPLDQYHPDIGSVSTGIVPWDRIGAAALS